MHAHSPILVVTPTLGESPYLAETVESVARQQADIRHVLVAPAARLPSLRQRFPHVECLPDAGKTGGLYGALNAALTGAGADWEWFTYINDDDALLPGFSEMFLRHGGLGSTETVLYGDVELIDANGGPVARITIERTPKWIPALLQQGISPLMQQGMLFSGRVVRALGGFDPHYRLCADLDFWLRAYALGARFRSSPHRVAQFRLRAGQLSGDTARTEAEQAEIVRRHLAGRVSPLKRSCARWRYRWCNLPRYLERLRTRGWRTSYALLREEGAR